MVAPDQRSRLGGQPGRRRGDAGPARAPKCHLQSANLYGREAQGGSHCPQGSASRAALPTLDGADSFDGEAGELGEGFLGDAGSQPIAPERRSKGQLLLRTTPLFVRLPESLYRL